MKGNSMYRILVADDKEVFRRKLKRLPYFRKPDSKFAITGEAGNGLECLKMMQENRYDIVITDIRMPVMDGLELLKEAKEKNLCSCIILLSEYADFSYAREGIINGAFDYIVKPVSEEKIAQILDRAYEFLLDQDPVEMFKINEIVEIILQRSPEFDKKLLNFAREKLKAGMPARTLWENCSQILEETTKRIFADEHLLEDYLKYQKKPFPVSVSAKDVVIHFIFRMDEFRKTYDLLSYKDKHPMVRTACEYVLGHPDEKISQQKIAVLLYTNRSYFSQLFKKEMGIGFNNYVNASKMEYAKRILSGEDIKIAEVAANTGFSDVEYFSRVFRMYTGSTPIHFRDSLRL